MRPRILLVVNVDWYFLSHRLPLARALRDAGCEVVVATGVERGCREAIEREGFRFVPLKLQRHLTAPWRELASAWELIRLYRRERPRLVHHVAIKPVIYGSLAARVTGVPIVINTIPGLGYTFLGVGLRGRVLRRAVSVAYRVALASRRVRVIFQNPDDRDLFVERHLVPAGRAALIRGSGVDVRAFSPSEEPPGDPMVLLAARLLWDKGVGEFVEAARQLRGRGQACRFVLVGVPDEENPKPVPEATLRAWSAEGIVEWWGLRDDMASVVRQASVVALPTYYREGIPKILLEAAASGRPIVTTDVSGCREIVRDGEDGLLVPPRDASALAEAIATLLHDRSLRERMGRRGREIAVSKFSEEAVMAATLSVYRDALGHDWPQGSVAEQS
jgi:glycosyltransferase involved in cell wall biosynthesis